MSAASASSAPMPLSIAAFSARHPGLAGRACESRRVIQVRAWWRHCGWNVTTTPRQRVQHPYPAVVHVCSLLTRCRREVLRLFERCGQKSGEKRALFTAARPSELTPPALHTGGPPTTTTPAAQHSSTPTAPPPRQSSTCGKYDTQQYTPTDSRPCAGRIVTPPTTAEAGSVKR